MNIAVISRHEGMDYYFKDILEDHELTFYNVGNSEEPKAGHDVYVVGLPVKDIQSVIKFGKPIISYPCLWDYQKFTQGGGYEAIKAGLDADLLTVVMNDNVWSEKLRQGFPAIQTEYIPYCFKGLPRWIGDEEKAIIVCRKPEDRLKVHTDKSVKELMGDLPYEVHTRTEHFTMLDRMSSCRVLFYFSNSPWTLVFCEGLSMGLPIVSFNKFPTGDFANVAANNEVQATDAIKRLLQDKGLAQQYSARNLRLADRIMNFEQAKEDWNKLLRRV
jgi:hypothetical protein